MNSRNASSPDWRAAQTVLKNGKLSIIMPAHNLEREISENLLTVRNTFRHHIPFEIIAVDDGSNDYTSREIEKTAGKFPEIIPVLLGANSGKGHALLEGFHNSTGSHILFLDADLDLPPDQTSGMFEIMLNDKSDIVIGSKRHRQSQINYPLHRKIISSIYYFIVKILFGLSVHDTQTGIKLLTRKALEYVNTRMLVKRFAFDLEMLVIADEKGFKISESPVTLDFHLRFGCVRPRAVKKIIIDTLAILYRSRILKYYRSIPRMKMPAESPMVSILIAYRLHSILVDECLRSIAKQTYTRWEVILLPDQIEGKETKAPNVKVVATGKVSPAEKKNIGIKKASGSIIAFLDDNTAPVPQWLRQAVSYFSSPSTGAVGGPRTTFNSDSFMARMSGRVFSNILVSGRRRFHYTPTRVIQIEDFPGCNFFVRKDILKRLKGFRTDRRIGECTMLCQDIVNKEHKKIFYDPRIEVASHREKLFLPHLRQTARSALRSGYFVKTLPEMPGKLSYALPSLLIAGIFLGALLSLTSNLILSLYISTLGLYVLTVLLFSISTKPVKWLVTSLGIISTHITYGLFFIAGLAAKKKN